MSVAQLDTKEGFNACHDAKHVTLDGRPHGRVESMANSCLDVVKTHGYRAPCVPSSQKYASPGPPPPPQKKKKLGALFCTPIFFFRLSCRRGHLISLHFHVNKNWRCWVGEWNRHEMQCINLSIYQQRTHHLGQKTAAFPGTSINSHVFGDGILQLMIRMGFIWPTVLHTFPEHRWFVVGGKPSFRFVSWSEAEELGANLHQLKTDPKATKKRPERSLQTCQQKRVMIFS